MPPKRPGKQIATSSDMSARRKKVSKGRSVTIGDEGVDDSGPRHLKSQGISASSRRLFQQTTVVPDRPFDSEDEDDPADMFVNDDGNADFANEFENEVEEVFQECVVRKGRRGRFVGSLEGSSSSKKGDDGSWRVTTPMGGGPIDGSVIPSFAAHVSSFIWNGIDRGLITCYQRMVACEHLRQWATKFQDPVASGDQGVVVDTRSEDEVELNRLVSSTGLHSLPSIMYPHVDTPLLCAFVERWQPDTNTFHLPVGEMTIMLHDVWFILGLPIDGELVNGVNPHLLVDLCGILGVSEEQLLSLGMYKGGGVETKVLFRSCRDSNNLGPEVRAIGYLLLTLGSTLFVDRSGSRLRGGLLTQVLDLDKVKGYSWGSACLANMYRQLGEASRNGCRGFGGCMTLLQAWIYEYFPCFRPHRERHVVGVDEPRAGVWEPRCEPRTVHRLLSIRQRIDQLTLCEVTWLPYGSDPWKVASRTLFSGFITHQSIIELYSPARCLRQLGFVQTIPPAMPAPSRVIRADDPRSYTLEYAPGVVEMCWSMFPHAFSLIPSTYAVATIPYKTADDYLIWFEKHSHPFVVNNKDVLHHQGPDATMPDYWMQQFSMKVGIVFDPLVDKLPEEFDKLKIALVGMRDMIRHFDKAVGLSRPDPCHPSEEDAE